MEGDIRFMNELLRIVNGALRLDVDKVRNYTAFLATKLDAAGESSTASRLRKVLEETDHELRPADMRFGRAIPVDGESRFPLLERVQIRAKEPALQSSRRDTRPAYLRQLLEEAEISQQAAAAALDVDARTMRRWLQQPGTPGALAVPYVVQYCLEALAHAGRRRRAR